MSPSLEALLQAAAEQLASVVEQPRAEAEWLLAEQLGLQRGALRNLTEPLSELQQASYATALAQRASGVPFAYVTGTQPFRRLTLHVTPEVLIPRADTEVLVAWALELLTEHAAPARVLDACTGSGCVALALTDEAPQHRVFASDCSATALAVAQANAERLGLAAAFFAADGLLLQPGSPRFHLITANPPYIAEHDPHLAALQHEPALALVSGADGLTMLRRLVAEAPPWLEAEGWLLLEHGFDQAAAVRELLMQGGFVDVTTRPDLGGRERVTGGRRPASA